MRRRLAQVFVLAVMLPYVAFETWQHWGKPEFWPLMGVAFVATLVALKAGRERREDLQARLPGARTLGH